MAVAMANHKKQTEAVKPAESTRKRTAILVPVTKKPDPVPHKAPKIANEVYYVCELCPSTFNRKFNRDRHMEVMHGAAVSTRTRPLYPDRIRNSEYSPDADLSDDNIPEPKIPVQEPPPLAKPVLVNPVDPAVKPAKPAVEPLKQVEPEPESDDDQMDTENIQTADKNIQTDPVMECGGDTASMHRMPLGKEVCITILVTSK